MKLKSVLRTSWKIVTILFVTTYLINLNPTDTVRAAVIEVDTTTEETTNNGNCSLQEAIQAANTNTVVDNCIAGGATDTIIVPAGTYNLTSALALSTNITLSGSGTRNTIFDGGGSTRVVNITNGTVNLQDLTIINGTEADFSQGAGIQITGGTVALESVAVAQNSGNGLLGAGIHVASGATLIVNHSTISGNIAADGIGGGIYSDGTLHINNSTISGNSVAGGGGFGDGGGVSVGFGAPATMRNVTFSGNIGAGGNPGGVSVSGSLNMQNSIITNSTGADCGDGFGLGTITGSNNLFDDTSCDGSATAVTNFDTTLQNNGGPTDSHAITSGSNAIDNGTASCPDHVPTALDFDQRGGDRNDAGAGSACDIGAYEYRTPVTNCSLSTGADILINGVTFNFNSLGGASCVTVEQMGNNHRAGTVGSGDSGINKGDWWYITANGTGFNTSVTLPYNMADANTSACRYPGALGGYGWDCAGDSFVANTSVTRNNVTQFSDWAVGQSVSPTSVTLQAVDAVTTNPVMWVLVALLLVLLSGRLIVRYRRN